MASNFSVYLINLLKETENGEFVFPVADTTCVWRDGLDRQTLEFQIRLICILRSQNLDV